MRSGMRVVVCFLLLMGIMAGGRVAAEESNLVVNPVFTNGPDPLLNAKSIRLRGGSAQLLLDGSTAPVTGWKLLGGHVYLLGSPSLGGARFLRLANRGAVSQTIHTTPGQQYQLTFLVEAWRGAHVSSEMDLRVSIDGKTAGVYQLNTDQPSRIRAVPSVVFTARKASTVLQFSSTYDGAHHGPSITDVRVVAYSPARAAVTGEIQKAYGLYYPARNRRDFASAFAFLAPEYRRQGRDGRVLEAREYQAEVRNARMPEGNPGIMTYRLLDVAPNADGSAAIAKVVEFYTYTKVDKSHKMRTIRLAWAVTDTWKATPSGWRLTGSTETEYQILVDQVPSPSIP